MTLAEIKSRWNEVLDEVLRHDRILWLAIFDARLASFENDILTLDFLDPGKFATEHDFSYIRDAQRVEKVTKIARNILGRNLDIVIKSGE